MSGLLKRYVEQFNANDEELYVNDIPNERAYEWLKDRIPLFECPDKEIERAYYFRWWTYRKHIKSTPDGYAVTEFLPNVPWAGKYNVINAPAGHHFYEGRWLRGSRAIFSDYLRHYLNNPEDSHRYSSWLLYAAMQYEAVAGSLGIGDKELEQMIEYYREWERTHALRCGMFWSYDNYDAMEYSISGTKNGNQVKGIRPTLNSYMYAEAVAIAYFAEKLGNYGVAEEFLNKAHALKRLINDNLLFDGFYKAKHGECDGEIEEIFGREGDLGAPMEEIGYIPFMFGIPSDDAARAFLLLDDEDIFLAKTGISTVDKRDRGFLGEFDHECLWNGYVWPFATSQTLTALINVIKSGHSELKNTFIRHIKLYADMHKIEKDGRVLPWIDEVMSPDEYLWTSRDLLEKWGWQEKLGGKERGKDYNHSTFCDLVISGIVGLRCEGDKLSADPTIPNAWDYFKLENVEYRGKSYTVIYDKTGEKYGCGSGLRIIEV